MNGQATELKTEKNRCAAAKNLDTVIVLKTVKENAGEN